MSRQLVSEYVKVSHNPAIGWISSQIIEDRIDAHHFNVNYLDKLAKIKYNISYDTISSYFDVTKLAGFEYTKYFIESGQRTIPAITSLNVQDCFLELNNTIFITDEIHKLLRRSALSGGQIVLSYTGIYRRAAVVPEQSNLHLGPNVCVLKPKKGINSYFITSYLNCTYGQTLLEREITISAQPTVNMNRIRNLLIPIPAYEIQSVINKERNNFCISPKPWHSMGRLSLK